MRAALLFFVALSCGFPAAKPSGPTSSDTGAPIAHDAGSQTDSDLAEIERAEDRRRASELKEQWLMSPVTEVRRHAVRALARIVDPSSEPAVFSALLRALADEDLEVTGWAAYGLGWACKGREDAHVKALAARAATLAGTAEPSSPTRGSIDARGSVLGAIGRCGGAIAEGALDGFLRDRASDAVAEQASFALGTIAGRHPLSDETIGELLDWAVKEPGSAASAAALFPLGRVDRLPQPWWPRVLAASRSVLAKPSPLRGFAVRALEKTGAEGAVDLGHAATRAELTAPERADAARALGRMGREGREAAASALVRVVTDGGALHAEKLMGDDFNVLLALVETVASDAPKSSNAALSTLSALPIPKSPPALARRVVMLRCRGAAALARGAYDADALVKCDPEAEGAIGQRAELAALVERPLVGERRRAFRGFASSRHVVVREAALEAIAWHPELDDTARALLVQGLGADEPGVVATAAETIVAHPERVLALAASEKRAALDPRAPPPTAHPAMDLPGDVSAALSHALSRSWKADAIETRVALLDAAVAVSLPDARAAATRACNDSNITMREHAVRALRSLGTHEAACQAPPATDTAVVPGASHPTRVTFDVAGRKLAIVFEPELTPIAAARFVALARADFYRGIVVHRVVPGYVVQFGDPGGDGYGGSGDSLRCETSPVPFDALDVGVALAGRDTGSSQLFVTLARYPKLDGDYARVGRAEGDWGAVAEGDIIDGVHVEE